MKDKFVTLGENKRWYVYNPDGVATPRNKWFYPSVKLNIDIIAFIDLILKYKGIIDTYNIENDTLIYHFDSAFDAEAWCRFLNKA